MRNPTIFYTFDDETLTLCFTISHKTNEMAKEKTEYFLRRYARNAQLRQQKNNNWGTRNIY